MRRLAVLLTGLILAACSPMTGEGPGSVPSVDTAACRANGGEVKPVCRMQKPACIFTNPDAGKACTDSSQCKGRCLARDGVPEAGTAAEGVCETDNDVCGCSAEILGGKVQPGLCVD